MLVKQFHYISKEESQMVLESINIKAQSNCAFDVGFAISKRAALNAKTLILKSKLPFNQQRGVKHLRTIPISNRLYQAIGEYLKTNEISIESNSFLFLQNCCSHFKKNNVGSTKPD
jgi:site-specific recombinase XerC